MAPTVLVLPVDNEPKIYEMVGRPPREVRFTGPSDTALIWTGKTKTGWAFVGMHWEFTGAEQALPRNPHVPRLAGPVWLMAMEDPDDGGPYKICSIDEALTVESIMTAVGIWGQIEDTADELCRKIVGGVEPTDAWLEELNRRRQDFHAQLRALPRSGS